MSEKRKQYSALFMSKVAFKGGQATSKIAACFQIHPTIVSTWKRDQLKDALQSFRMIRKRLARIPVNRTK